MRRVGIIDVGIGNLGSLMGALSSLGVDPFLVPAPHDVDAAEVLILPGVGAFTHGMTAIDTAGLRGAIRDYAAAGRPLLGICLGMQLLFERGEEGGDTPGLGILPGKIRRMHDTAAHPLPHVGWNGVRCQQSKHPLLRGMRDGVDFYFVHSYCAECSEEIVIGATDYAESFPSMVGTGNVFGTQFHPEKSQKNGLRLLESFCWWDGKC